MVTTIVSAGVIVSVAVIVIVIARNEAVSLLSHHSRGQKRKKKQKVETKVGKRNITYHGRGVGPHVRALV